MEIVFLHQMLAPTHHKLSGCTSYQYVLRPHNTEFIHTEAGVTFHLVQLGIQERFIKQTALIYCNPPAHRFAFEDKEITEVEAQKVEERQIDSLLVLF